MGYSMFRLKPLAIHWFFLCLLAACLTRVYAVEVPIYDFPLNNYSQDLNSYLPETNNDYDKLLLDPEYQKAQAQEFFRHYYASDEQGLSPWSARLIQNILPQVENTEWAVLDNFNNQKQEPANYHYAENFKEHDALWLNILSKNMHLEDLDRSFHPEQRAIVTQNTFARSLPETGPDFYHFSQAGQGFPFDNLQDSALWVGTPVYVLHVSQDKAWSLVLTPDSYFSWIKSNDLAYASSEFIQQWQAKAKKGLMAITQTQTSIVDEQQHFLFSSYIGAVFPMAEKNSVYIPLNNKQQATISQGYVNAQAIQKMPVTATKRHLAMLIKQLQNRPYGWGGAFFFNDCSQELKSLFAPFGIWLPRNSAQQAQYTSLDLSEQTMEKRVATLKQKGHPLMTIIYIGGHVMLYLGTQNNTVITYQNVWGLAPAARDKRYVIGQSALLPLLNSYPEYPDARALANGTYFKLIFLDDLAKQKMTISQFAQQFNQALNLEKNAHE